MTDNYGQDGTPHLTYYDKRNELSFVYDMAHVPTVAVSHGGYGEPVIDTFEIELVGSEYLGDFINTFKRYCEAYVAGWNMTKEVA